MKAMMEELQPGPGSSEGPVAVRAVMSVQQGRAGLAGTGDPKGLGESRKTYSRSACKTKQKHLILKFEEYLLAK